MDFASLVTQLMSLAGLGALIAVIVNILKFFNVIPEDKAMIVVTALNIVGMVALFALKVFLPNQDIGQLDAVAAGIAQVLVVVLGILVQIGASKLMHASVKGTPVLGHSGSLGMKRINAS